MLRKTIVITLLGFCSSAMAEGWQVKIGASAIAPSNDTFVNCVGVIKADSELAFTPSIEYFFANSAFSTELLLAAPVNHSVTINGVDALKLKHLPPTLTAKYHFKNSTGFTPYIGLGGTAFIAWDEQTKGGLTGTTVKVKEEFGFAGQVGFNYQPADAKNWGIFMDVRYAQLSPDVEVEKVTSFDLDIDPVIYSLGYSYKF